MNKALHRHLSMIGKRGGQAGKGETKVRGTSDYYRELVGRRKDRQKLQNARRETE